GGDPFDARVAASTSQQAAALAGGGQGRTTVEAGESRRGGGPRLLGCFRRWGGGGGLRLGWAQRSPSGPFRESCTVRRRRSLPSASTFSTTRFTARTFCGTPMR